MTTLIPPPTTAARDHQAELAGRTAPPIAPADGPSHDGSDPANTVRPVRPAWTRGDPVLEAYADAEWGRPVLTETGLFEHLVLEGFVLGLSWRTVLTRREALRAAFDGFEPDVVAAYDDADVERVLAAPDAIRNERKVRAVVRNARATVELRADGGLAGLVWSVQPAVTPVPRSDDEVPRTSPESERLASLLHDRGFTLVGPVTMQALLAAVGVIDLRVADDPLRGVSGLWTRSGRRRRRPLLP